MDDTETLRRADFAEKLVANPLWTTLLEGTRERLMHAWLGTAPDQAEMREAIYHRARSLVDLNAELLRWRNAGVALAANDAAAS